MSIDWLSNQVGQMLNASISKDEECKTQLVPNFCGTQLYDAKTCWGRLWSFIWDLIGLFDWNRECKEQAFLRAAQSVFNVWKEKRDEVQNYLSIFQHNLEQTLESGHNSEDRVPSSEQIAEIASEMQTKLIDWTIHLKSVFEKEGSGSLEHKIIKIDKILRTILGVDIGESVSVMKQAQIAYSILKLDQRLHIPALPPLFKKLAVNEQLTAEDERLFDHFIQQIKILYNQENKERGITVQDLHTICKTINEGFSPSEEGLQLIEWSLHRALLEEGCPIFFDKDPLHSQYSETYALQENAEVMFQGVPMPLGRQICSGKSIENEKHLVFENDPVSVFVFSTCNPAALMLEQSEAEINNWGLPLPELFYVGEQYSIYERLLEDELINSLNDGQASHLFQKKFNAIAALIKRMIAEKFTPQGFSSKMMRFDKNYHLKFLRLVPKGEFDWHSVNAFMKECCKSNIVVYYKLVEATGIGLFPITKVHKRLLTSAIRGEENKLQETMEAAWTSNEPEQQTCVRLAGNLQQQAIDFTDACFRQIIRDYEVDSEKELKRDIQKKTLSLSEAVVWGMLPTDLNPSEVVKAVLEFRSLELKKPVFKQKLLEVLHWFTTNQIEVEMVRNDPAKHSKLVKKRCKEIGIYRPSQIAQVEFEIFSRFP